MAQTIRPYGAQRARRDLGAARFFGAVTLCMALYGLFTGNAVGPAFGTVAPEAPVVETATLSYSGTDVIITGSVDHMFEVASFVGPNRSEKRARARIDVDVLSLTRSFDGVRQQIASLRNGPADPAIAGQQSLVAEASQTPDDEPAMSVASIDPTLIGLPPSSAALDAIAGLAGGQSSAPMPAIASQQLAYARANEPITEFEIKSKSGKQYSDKELWCLATAIYFEARGESYRGQVAVGQVVMNRVAHRLYPKTICGVVFQNQHWRNRCQFSFACDGIPEVVTERKSWAQAQEIAKGIVKGELYLTEVANATHYHASYVYPDWAPRLKKVTKIGLHVFYRFKRG